MAVEEARQQVAGLIGARPREVVLTGGATERIAAACAGVPPPVARIRWSRRSSTRPCAWPPSATARSPRPVDGRGAAAEDVLAAVRPDTALVHVQWGNHEVGTVQPVAEVVAACRERVLVHVDAAQAVGHVDVDFRALGTDLMSISAHKFGGPTGVGALLVRQGCGCLAPAGRRGPGVARRAGLENVPAIAGLGALCGALAEGAVAADGPSNAG